METDVRLGSRFQHNDYYAICNNLLSHLLWPQAVTDWALLAQILDLAVKTYHDNHKKKRKSGDAGVNSVTGVKRSIKGITENATLGEVVVKVHVMGHRELAEFLFGGVGQREKFIELQSRGITVGDSKGIKKELSVLVETYAGIPKAWYNTRVGAVYASNKASYDYDAQTVRETFNSVVKIACDAVIDSLKTNPAFEKKPALQQAVAEKAVDYVATGLAVRSPLRFAEVCVMIVTSIKLFLALLFSSGTRTKEAQLYHNVLITAATWSHQLTESEALEFLGVRKTKIKGLYFGEYCDEKESAKTGLDEDESDGVFCGGCDGGSPARCGAVIGCDGSCDLSSPSKALQAHNDGKLKEIPLAMKKSILDYLDDFLTPYRMQRKDVVDLQVAFCFWHENCNLQTTSCRHVMTTTPYGNVEIHKTHEQTMPATVLFNRFLESPQYAAWQIENPGKSIGRRKFDQAKCPCIQCAKPNDTVDQYITQWEIMRVGLGRIRKMIADKVSKGEMNACACGKCNDANWKVCHASMDSMGKYMSCPARDWAEFELTSFASYAEFEAFKADLCHTKSSAMQAEKLFQCKKVAPVVQVKLEKALPKQNIKYRLPDRTCGHLECNMCGMKGCLRSAAKMPSIPMISTSRGRSSKPGLGRSTIIKLSWWSELPLGPSLWTSWPSLLRRHCHISGASITTKCSAITCSAILIQALL